MKKKKLKTYEVRMRETHSTDVEATSAKEAIKYAEQNGFEGSVVNAVYSAKLRKDL